jgi:3,4-dihydroxy 2-butanone 4-phosphate synthase/GTP cyclohydrolase II
MIEPDFAEFGFMEPLLRRLQAPRNDRPFVTLSYAQSLDGSISVDSLRACSLSSERSLRLTHFLRSSHDALLVGINTILCDDPQLTVRHWAGPSPCPVVLDKSLRLPSDARLLNEPSRCPIVVTTNEGPLEDRQRLLERGAEVLVATSSAEGMVDLAETLRLLHRKGLRSVMVEGGSSVITHFLRERLVDYCVITIAPKLIGGLKAVNGLCLRADHTPLSFLGCQYQVLDGDLIAFGPLDPD